MSRARDISKLLSTTNGKIAGENLDVSFENINDTGTEGTKVASGTTAQRGSTTGQWRYNTTTGFFEGRNTDGTFSSLEPVPAIISVNISEVDSQAGGNVTIRVTGTNFTSGATIKFIGNDASEITASTSTFVNTSNYDAVIPKSSFLNAKEPYDVRYIASSGLTATADNLINVDTSPSWQTASGSLGSVSENTNANFSVSATDADGDTVSYSETTSVLSGAGFSLNPSTGAITGTANAVSSDTTNTFTLRATANGKTTDRQFNIITSDLGILATAEFYIDPSNSSSWSGSGSSLTNISPYSSKSANTTNLSLNGSPVATSSGITSINYTNGNSSQIPTATIGNISGNLQNYTFAFFFKHTNTHSNSNGSSVFFGNTTTDQAIGMNEYTNGTINHYNYGNDAEFNTGATFTNWNFIVLRKTSGTKECWVNNSQITNTGSVSNDNTNLPNNGTLQYGSRADYDLFSTSMGFCGIWTSSISTSDISFLWNKFKGDYGL